MTPAADFLAGTARLAWLSRTLPSTRRQCAATAAVGLVAGLAISLLVALDDVCDVDPFDN